MTERQPKVSLLKEVDISTEVIAGNTTKTLIIPSGREHSLSSKKLDMGKDILMLGHEAQYLKDEVYMAWRIENRPKEGKDQSGDFVGLAMVLDPVDAHFTVVGVCIDNLTDTHLDTWPQVDLQARGLELPSSPDGLASVLQRRAFSDDRFLLTMHHLAKSLAGRASFSLNETSQEGLNIRNTIVDPLSFYLQQELGGFDINQVPPERFRGIWSVFLLSPRLGDSACIDYLIAGSRADLKTVLGKPYGYNVRSDIQVLPDRLVSRQEILHCPSVSQADLVVRRLGQDTSRGYAAKLDYRRGGRREPIYDLIGPWPDQEIGPFKIYTGTYRYNLAIASFSDGLDKLPYVDFVQQPPIFNQSKHDDCSLLYFSLTNVD